MRLPVYSFIGLAIMAASEVLLLAHIEPSWSWHTPIAWTGYILLVDGAVRARRGSSWLTQAKGEFTFLTLMSIPLWLIFEGYNLLIRNWHYVNLPVNPFWRTLGYAWSFATIWPAVFETAELVAIFRGRRDPFVLRPAQGEAPQYGSRAEGPAEGSKAVRGTASAEGYGRLCSRLRRASTELKRAESGVPGRSVTARSPEPVGPRTPSPLSTLAQLSVVMGALMLSWPLVRPSPYLAAPVWLGFIFLLDPLNSRAGAEAIGSDWSGHGRERLVNLSISGFMCGVIWEFWNYWARAKWIYTVPIFPTVQIFEMPLPGYLGFPAFAVECFTMYVAVRRWLWRGTARPIGL